jgi:hypothetical protein
VSALLESTFRFLAGGALSFLIAEAVPFFVLAGAGRFFEGAGSSLLTSSVVGTGTEDSRSGDGFRWLLSCLRATIVFEDWVSMSDGRRVSEAGAFTVSTFTGTIVGEVELLGFWSVVGNISSCCEGLL